MRNFQDITINLLGRLARYDELEGRRYLVVPMVMLTEGVHQGSQGPLLYLREEIGKTPESWNHKPIIVYHPTENGKGISACDPIILSNRKVGLIMRAREEGGKLKAEAWLEEDRVKLVDHRILDAIERNEVMELSTGLFTDNEPTDGEWKGEKYVGIARNFRPDHLAVLPDQKGACSIADGAGLLRNKEEEAESARLESRVNLLEERVSLMNKEQMIGELIANSDWSEEDRGFLMELEEVQLRKMMPVTIEKEVIKEVPVENSEEEPKETPEIPEEPKPTFEELLANADQDARDMWEAGMAAAKREKASYIATITANAKNKFAPEQLSAKSITELAMIADLAVVEEKRKPPVYSGMADVAPPTTNVEEEEEPLLMPAINWEEGRK